MPNPGRCAAAGGPAAEGDRRNDAPRLGLGEAARPGSAAGMVPSSNPGRPQCRRSGRPNATSAAPAHNPCTACRQFGPDAARSRVGRGQESRRAPPRHPDPREEAHSASGDAAAPLALLSPGQELLPCPQKVLGQRPQGGGSHRGPPKKRTATLPNQHGRFRQAYRKDTDQQTKGLVAVLAAKPNRSPTSRRIRHAASAIPRARPAVRRASSTRIARPFSAR